MAYINGIWNFPKKLMLTLDEDLMSAPQTKILFEQPINGTLGNGDGYVRGNGSTMYLTSIKLILSSEDLTKNDLFYCGRVISSDGDDYGDAEWRYQNEYYGGEPTIDGNIVTISGSSDYSYEYEVNFGIEHQEVSDEFYNWWTTNAIEVPNMSVDLSRYNLSGDTHTVVIKTLDANGNVIDISNEVVWEKVAVIPEGWSYMISSVASEDIWLEAGEPFPPLPTNDDEYHQCFDDEAGMSYGYSIETRSWSVVDALGTAPDNWVCIDYINGTPVSHIENTTQFGGGFDDVAPSRFGPTHVTLPSTIIYISAEAFGYYTNLTNITFTGTMEQWNNINFGDMWNYHCPVITVTCSDGTITVPKYSA